MVKNAIKVYARLKPERNRKDVANYQIRHRPKDHSEEDFLLLMAPQKSTEYIDHRPESWSFSFSRIFEENTPQSDIFKSIAQPVIESALDGYNGTIFAYGQTGSGKTYTITGDQKEYDSRGILPRCLQYLFDVIRKHPENVYSIKVAYLEIYNENGYDLLDRKQRREFATRLEDLPRVSIQEDEIGRLHLKNLSFHCVANEQDAFELLLVGDGNRVTADTPMNQQSSRSHCIFTVAVCTKQFGANHYKRSKLHLVDLAGSERVYKCAITGTILTEAKHINLSLHYLEQVIVCLGQQSSSHIPYRNSLLTAILRDSLGGNCLTTMLATLSVSSFNFEETISTCRFAQRVALIKNDVNLIFERDVDSENKLLRLENERLKQQIQAVTKQNNCGELTVEEKETLESQIRQFVETNVTISWDYDPRKVRYCLESLRKNVVLSTDENSCMKKLEYYKDMVMQRDKEISLLIDMLKKEREKKVTGIENGQMENAKHDSATTIKEEHLLNDNASVARSNMASNNLSEHCELVDIPKNSTQLSTTHRQTNSTSNKTFLQENLLKQKYVFNSNEANYELNNHKKDVEKRKHLIENKKSCPIFLNAGRNLADNLNLLSCNIVNLSVWEARKGEPTKHPESQDVVSKLEAKLEKSYRIVRKRTDLQNVLNENVSDNSNGNSNDSKTKPSQGKKMPQKEREGATNDSLKTMIEEPRRETQFFFQECNIFNKPSDLLKVTSFEYNETEPKGLPNQPVELQDDHLHLPKLQDDQFKLNSVQDVYNSTPNVDNYTHRRTPHLKVTPGIVKNHQDNNNTKNYNVQKCVNDLMLKDAQKLSNNYDVGNLSNKIPVNDHEDFLENVSIVTKHKNLTSDALNQKNSLEDLYHAQTKPRSSSNKHRFEQNEECKGLNQKTYRSNYFDEQDALHTIRRKNIKCYDYVDRDSVGETYYPFGNRSFNEQNVQRINKMDVHNLEVGSAEESCFVNDVVPMKNEPLEDRSFDNTNDDFEQSLPLTGDPEIDEEIIAFYKAKRSGGTY